MPKRTDLKSIMIIGAGPIVIGQACEFDYSGTQGCRALRALGLEVVLLNSNPATIMTDPEFADRTYIEPLLPEFAERVIEKERPDALLPTMGGQTALNLAVALAKRGTLDRYNVKLIGASLEAIETAEDRALFKRAMEGAGLKLPRSGYATSVAEAVQLGEALGYPLVIRSSFTLGGAGSGLVSNMRQLREQARMGIAAAPRRIIVADRGDGMRSGESRRRIHSHARNRSHVDVAASHAVHPPRDRGRRAVGYGRRERLRLRRENRCRCRRHHDIAVLVSL